MGNQVLQSRALHSIPEKKLRDRQWEVLKKCEICSVNKDAKLEQACKKCNLFNLIYFRYYQANIPIKYWDFKMENFEGLPKMKKVYDNYISNIDDNYRKGKSIIFRGNFGVGKTFVSANILKRAAEKAYSCLYVTLNDIVYSLINNSFEDKSFARQELLMVDFLAIDEFDPRHTGSDQSKELFGRVLEDIFRCRVQNTLPTIFCTNTLKTEDAFPEGAIRNSMISLMNYVENVIVLDKDHRKEGK